MGHVANIACMTITLKALKFTLRGSVTQFFLGSMPPDPLA